MFKNNLVRRFLPHQTLIPQQQQQLVIQKQQLIGLKFRKMSSGFRNLISSDSNAGFPAEKDRYLMYVCLGCPWAHRAMLARNLKGLEEIVPINLIHPDLDEIGWKFTKEFPDTVNGADRLIDLYHKVDPSFDKKATVPTIWDKKKHAVVSNESGDIVKFFYTEFDQLLPEEKRGSYYPQDLAKEIDELNEFMSQNIIGLIYKTGSAPDQETYDTNLKLLYKGLDTIEDRLANSKGDYLHGDRITDSDVLLFPFIFRFDIIYVQSMKLNVKDIRSGYPHIHKWLQNLYWNNPAFKNTSDAQASKHLLYRKHKPDGIIPAGPVPDVVPL